jgi:hypothetical protein
VSEKHSFSVTILTGPWPLTGLSVVIQSIPLGIAVVHRQHKIILQKSDEMLCSNEWWNAHKERPVALCIGDERMRNKNKKKQSTAWVHEQTWRGSKKKRWDVSFVD